jgi:hypothetical protein
VAEEEEEEARAAESARRSITFLEILLNWKVKKCSLETHASSLYRQHNAFDRANDDDDDDDDDVCTCERPPPR